MDGWVEFGLAMACFLASHVVPVRLKAPLVGLLGRRGYLIGYSLLSLVLLWWLITAAGRAPFVELWPQQVWMRWLVNLAVPVAIALGVTGGMVGLMAAFALWASAHLIANGDLAHAILFGLLLAYALFGLLLGLRKGARWRVTPLRLALGLGLWVGLYLLHPLLTGVSPAP